MGVEIEKKFLVHTNRWAAAKGSGKRYEQGYLLRQPGKTIRVRRIEGEGGYLTIKGKATGFSRPEYEYAIPEAAATELLQQFCEAIITKRRYKLQVAGKQWEVDEFSGDNEGLILAEIELENADETFELPDWVSEEVTDDQRYYNSNLLVNPYKNWEGVKKKAEREYLDKCWKKMQQHFKTFIQEQNSEALHRFRVQVKKIRSLLMLLAQNDRNAPLLKTFKPVRKMFKTAGVVRDVALHEQQAKAAGINWEPLSKEQHQQQDKAICKLIARGKKQLRKMKAVKRALQQQMHPLSAAQINAFYEKQCSYIQQLLAQPDFSEALHDARKMLKHLLYNKSIFRKNIPDGHLSFTYINTLQSLIGNWHDNKLALVFFIPHLDNKELAVLQAKNIELERAITEKGKDFSRNIQGNMVLEK